ncbi:unnamed protein product [Caenorhabditis nigoni]
MSVYVAKVLSGELPNLIYFEDEIEGMDIDEIANGVRTVQKTESDMYCLVLALRKSVEEDGGRCTSRSNGFTKLAKDVSETLRILFASPQPQAHVPAPQHSMPPMPAHLLFLMSPRVPFSVFLTTFFF